MPAAKGSARTPLGPKLEVWMLLNFVAKLYNVNSTLFSYVNFRNSIGIEALVNLMLDWGLPLAGLFFALVFWLLGILNYFSPTNSHSC